ncbi:MAG: fibronectin type III domain-containing protein [Parcubacteria group bacterium]
MTKIFKKLILFSAVAASALFFAPNALAADFNVTNTDLPFANTNLVPGGSVTKTLTIQNTFGVTKKLGIEVSGTDSSGLASQITLKVAGDGANYEDKLSNFLNNWVIISEIASGTSKTHSLTITLANDVSQSVYEGKSFSFDLNIGSCDINDSECTIVTVGPEKGGGGGRGSIGLIITNDRNDEPLVHGDDPQTATITVRWDTNIPATSQVIYGLEEEGPFTLNVNTLPYLGYPSGTLEFDTVPKVTSHVIELTGLIPGKTYKYRVVSRASPPTVSFEKEFTVPTSGGAEIRGGGLALGGTGQTGGGSLAPDGTGGTEEQTGNNQESVGEGTDNTRGLATILAAMGEWFSEYWWLVLILIFVLVIGYLLGRFAKKKGKKTEQKTEQK